MSILNLVRPDLTTIQGYKPTGDDLECRLHANELPWAPVSLEQIALNHYPDVKQQQALQEQMADYYQVQPEQMVLTRGSDDGIDLVMRLFLRAGIDSFMQCPPTFPMYAFYARLQQAGILNSYLKPKMDLIYRLINSILFGSLVVGSLCFVVPIILQLISWI